MIYETLPEEVGTSLAHDHPGGYTIVRGTTRVVDSSRSTPWTSPSIPSLHMGNSVTLRFPLSCGGLYTSKNMRTAPAPQSERAGTQIRHLCPDSLVELSGLNQNTWRKMQKLAAAWEKVRTGGGARHHQPPEPPPMSVAQPSRRARTPLTPSEVDSIRTLRTAGVSVNQLAKQFGVHRSTVWGKTRQT